MEIVGEKFRNGTFEIALLVKEEYTYIREFSGRRIKTCMNMLELKISTSTVSYFVCAA